MFVQMCFFQIASKENSSSYIIQINLEADKEQNGEKNMLGKQRCAFVSHFRTLSEELDSTGSLSSSFAAGADLPEAVQLHLHGHLRG